MVILHYNVYIVLRSLPVYTLKKKNTKLIKQKIHIFLAVDPTLMSLEIP